MVMQELNKELEKLIKIGKLFEQRGWFLGTSGNMSIITSRSPLSFAITVSGLDKGDLIEDDFVVVDGNGRPCIDLSDTLKNERPSDEYAVHQSIYRLTDAQCIIHVHVVSGLLIADLHGTEGKIKLERLEVLKGLGCKSTSEALELVIINNRDNAQELANDIARVIEQCKGAMAPAVLVKNHGMFVWGDSIFSARRHVELLSHVFEYLLSKRLFVAKK